MLRTGRPPLPEGQKLTKKEMHERYMAKLYADPERHARHCAKKNAERAARMLDPEKRRHQNEISRVSNAESQKRALRDPKRWPARMLIKLRHRCKMENIAFNLTVEDLAVPEVCPVFGTPFVFGVAQYREDNTPSVDRIRPALGYTKGNVRIISWRANHLKNNCTSAEELRKVAADLEQLHGDTQ
jgi:hypothetical protein